MPLALKIIATLLSIALAFHAALSVSERGLWRAPPSDWDGMVLVGFWLFLTVVIWTT